MYHQPRRRWFLISSHVAMTTVAENAGEDVQESATFERMLRSSFQFDQSSDDQQLDHQSENGVTLRLIYK